MKKLPYRFWNRKGTYYIQFAHTPGKWVSSGQKDRDSAVRWAELNLYETVPSSRKIPTLKDFADGFFIPGRHNWREREESKNRLKSEQFYSMSQGRLDNYIIPEFGHYLINVITPRMIDDWLISLHSVKYKRPASDNTKNKILWCLRYIFQEAKDQGYISSNPAKDVSRIIERNEKRSVFSKDELNILFPSDENLILQIWLTKEWHCFFRIMTVCGLRPGEVSALTWADYHSEYHGLVINKALCSPTGEIKGLKTDKKGMSERAAFLDDITEVYLNDIKPKNTAPWDLIFKNSKGGPFRAETGRKHFLYSLARAGIEPHGRTPYSLRHTFDTEMLRKLDRDAVNDLMGHTSYRPEYDHRDGIDILKKHLETRKIVNASFGNG